MKKSILNLGRALNKAEQKNVNGGNTPIPIKEKFKCSVNYGDPRCCTPSECGDTGGYWNPGQWGYGTSANCVCF